MPDHSFPTDRSAEALDDIQAEARERACIREEIRRRARARVAAVEELSDFCQRALVDLVTEGTKLAKVVVDRAEFDVVHDMGTGYGGPGFKGGAQAAKAYALASQSVRRSVLLLQRVMHLEWWFELPSVTASRNGNERPSAGGGDGDDDPAAEAVDRLERLETIETCAGDIAPERVSSVIDGLQQDVATAKALANRIWRRNANPYADVSSPCAAKPQDLADPDYEDGDWKHPPD